MRSSCDHTGSAKNIRLGLTSSSCAAMSSISSAPASAVRSRTPKIAGAQEMHEEQRRDDIAGAVHGGRQFRRAQSETAGRVRRDEIDRVFRRLLGMDRGRENRARPARVQRVDRSERRAERGRGFSGKLLELELVGRDHVG
jgi:hypothetical protein